MIFKLIAFLLIISIIYLLFFRKSRGRDIQNNKDCEIDTMYECPKCKTFVSRDDAILSNGKYFCSKECLG